MYTIIDKMAPGIGIGKQSSPSQNIQPGAGGLIECPNANDVLSGRGGRINNHSGNLYYRTLVNRYKHNYLDKHTKKLDKVKIANHIVMLIRTTNPPGRFLIQDADTKCWKEIGDEKAKKKAGQAMREDAPQTRRDLEEGKVTPLAVNSAVDVHSNACISPLANSPNHVSYNPGLMHVASHPGAIPAPVTSHPRVVPAPVGSHPGAIPERVASYPPAGGYPQAGSILYDSNSFPSAVASAPAILNYVTYDQAALPTSSGLPTEQTNETIPQPLPYRICTELGKHGQNTIPEEYTPEQRELILGAKAAAFDRTFNPLRDSSSTNKSDVSSLSRKSFSSSKVSIGSSKASPNSPSYPIDTTPDHDVKKEKCEKDHPPKVGRDHSMPVHSENDPYNQYPTNILRDDEDAKREKYRQRIAAGAGHSEKDLLDQYHDRVSEDSHDRENSYLPHRLIERDTSETSLKMSDVSLYRNSDIMRMSINSSHFAATHGRELSREMSLNMDDSGNFSTFLNNEPNLNVPELALSDAQLVMADWSNSRRSSSGSSDPKMNRRERFKSDTSVDAMSFRVEKGKSEYSSDDMSLVSRSSRRSNASSWLNSFKGMQLPPPGEARQRLFSDFSNRSMLSELSSDMVALDLAADGSNYFNDQNSPPMSPPTSP